MIISVMDPQNVPADQQKINTPPPIQPEIPQPTIPETPRSYKTLYIVIGIFVVLILTIAGYIFVSTRQARHSQTSRQDEQKVQPTSGKTSGKTTDEIAHWTLYKNPSHGFSLKYPSMLHLDVQEYPGGSGLQFCLEFKKGATTDLLIPAVFAGGGSCIFADLGVGAVSKYYEAGREAGFSDFKGYYTNGSSIIYKFGLFGEGGVEIPQKQINKIFNNPQGVEIVLIDGKNSEPSADNPGFPIPGLPQEGQLGAIINTNNATFPGISLTYTKSSSLVTEKEFNQILSTITLTDQNPQDETADWQTYTDDTYGFTFKYPADYIAENEGLKPRTDDHNMYSGEVRIVWKDYHDLGQAPQISLEIARTNKSFEEYVAQFMTPAFVTSSGEHRPEDVRLDNGIMAKRLGDQNVIVATGPNPYFTTYYFQKNGYVYMLKANYSVDNHQDYTRETLNAYRIASSFSFK